TPLGTPLGSPNRTPSPPPNGNMANRPWLDQDAVAVPGAQHNLPRNPEKFLPKFDPSNNESAEENIKKFMLAI
ncbi:MAG: hypothetical protein Q4E87_04875, partial [bacterium]|nr:hypothetical protein [bacterium]